MKYANNHGYYTFYFKQQNLALKRNLMQTSILKTDQSKTALVEIGMNLLDFL